MKYIFLFPLLFLFLFSKAQDTLTNTADDEDDSVTFTSRNYMEISYSFDHPTRFLNLPEGTFIGAGSKPSYSFEIALYRQARQKLGYSVGVGCSVIQLQSHTFFFPPDTSSQVHEVSVVYTPYFVYLDFPATFFYDAIGKKKFKAGICGGITPEFNIYEQFNFYKYYSNNSALGSGLPIGKKKDVFNLDVHGGIFFEYNIERLKLFMEPAYKFDLLNTYPGLKGKHTTSANLVLGCRF